jgi:hypothetical protein
LTEKEKTAFHEAGHCYRAFLASSLAFKSVCIYEDGGEWRGATGFRRSWVAEAARAEVAVAGFLAEAKALASMNGLRDVNWNAVVRDRILELIDDELPKPKIQQEEHVWPVNVPLVGGGSQVANFTRSDMEEIPPAVRTEAGIEAALTNAVGVINAPEHWAAISDVAAELNAFAPKCLGGVRIYQIIRDATAGLLEQGQD